MTERFIMDFIHNECANEINIMLYAISNAASTVANGLIAEYDATSDDLNTAEIVFKQILDNAI